MVPVIANGNQYVHTQQLADGNFTTGHEIDRCGDEVVARIEQRWNELADSLRSRKSTLSMARYLCPKCCGDLSAHPALHARELIAMVERLGADRRMAEDLPGITVT